MSDQITRQRGRSLEDTSSSSSGTAKQFPCSVCKKWPMLVPVYQCKDGHVFCNPCSFGLHCESCKMNFPQREIRNRAVEALQPDLTKCSQKGCDELFTDEKDMRIHVEKECNFIKVSLCQILELESGSGTCPIKCKPGKITEVIRHLHEAHDVFGSKVDSAFYHRWIVPAAKGKYFGQVLPGLWYIAQDEVLVVIKVFEEGGRRFIRVAGFGNRVALQMWRMTLRFTLRHSVKLNLELDATYRIPLASVTDEDAESLKQVSQFEAGAMESTLKELVLEFRHVFGKINEDKKNIKKVLTIGEESEEAIEEDPYDAGEIDADCMYQALTGPSHAPIRGHH